MCRLMSRGVPVKRESEGCCCWSKGCTIGGQGLVSIQEDGIAHYGHLPD